MEATEIHPATVPPHPSDEKLRADPPETTGSFPAPDLRSPVLERVREEQQALRANHNYCEARAADDAKLQSEQDAFRRLLPDLLKTYRNQYVAIHEGQVVGTGPDQIELADRSYDRFGYVPILVTLVTDRPRVVRVPSPRGGRVEDRA